AAGRGRLRADSAHSRAAGERRRRRAGGRAGCLRAAGRSQSRDRGRLQRPPGEAGGSGAAPWVRGGAGPNATGPRRGRGGGGRRAEGGVVVTFTRTAALVLAKSVTLGEPARRQRASSRETSTAPRRDRRSRRLRRH